MTTSLELMVHRIAFDSGAEVVTDWLRSMLTGPLKESRTWLVLEQMHRLDFVGPGPADVAGAVTNDALGRFGLRGRLFWDTGQVEWRRMDTGSLRVVGLTEDAAVAHPAGVEPSADSQKVAREDPDSRLVLWGTSDSKGRFLEQRVGGSAELAYPQALKNAAVSQGAGTRPVLLVRRYFDPQTGVDFAWRFCGADVRTDKELEQ
jgi:hypothetical protein